MKNQAAIKLLAMSAVLGVMVGLVTDLFIRLLKFFTNHIWSDILPPAHHKPWAVLLVTISGGLLMGLCVRYFSVNEGIGFEAVMAAMKKDGGLRPVQLPRVALNSFIGLISGASIGPEAALITLGGMVGGALGNRLKLGKAQLMGIITIALGGSLGVLLDSPVAGPILLTESRVSDDDNKNRLLIFCSMVAASLGYGVYLLLKGTLLTNITLVPSYSGFRLIHLLYGLAIGVVGTVVGLSLRFLIIKQKAIYKGLDKRPVVRGGLVGLAIGITGIALPLTMFDGSSQLAHIVANVSQYSVLMLVTLGMVRLLMTSVALSGGYQGGNIFPTIFITGVLGLALHGIFPSIPAAVAMMACMVPAMYVFTPLPLFTIFLFTEIGSFSLIPVMAMALVSAYLITQYQASKNGTASLSLAVPE